ncbi:MAG: discoidin domain-containing protein, partial [Clostridia bacterium]|nr:discoidin domain-containing protein [Clostridia bacterium]
SDDRNIFKLNDGKNSRFDTITKNSDGSMDITVDLGKEYVIGQASLNLAGFYEDHIYNIRDFAFYVSSDGNTYKMVYKKVANKNAAANFYFDAINARYVRLHIITPNNSQSAVEKQRVSLAEILVYGTDSLKTDNSVTAVENSGKSYSGYRADTADYEPDEEAGTPAVEKTEQKAPKLPEYIIPAIYKYIWLFISGGLLLLAGGFWLFILLISRKRKNNQ